MSKYGQVHSISDFIERTIPKRGEVLSKHLFSLDVLKFFKEMCRHQKSNNWLLLNFYAADGLWVHYRGQLIFTITPAQKHLRLIVNKRVKNEGLSELVRQILTFARSGSAFQNTLHSRYFYQWLMDAKDLELFAKFVGRLKSDNAKTRFASAKHPRNFSSEARIAALNAFTRTGNWCPGVPGVRGQKRHKVNYAGGDRIEFDHIIPHSRFGSNSEFNVQVLCSKCNSAKRARVL